MNCLILHSGLPSQGDLVREKILEILAADHIDTYGSLQELISRLFLPKEKPTVAILEISSLEVLIEICQNRDLFADVIVILYVRNCSDEMLSQCYLMRPRLIFGSENELEFLPMVLQKIHENFMKNFIQLPINNSWWSD